MGVIGDIAGAIIGGNAAKKAANVQAEGAKYAADMQWKMFDQSRSDMEPWRQAGGVAIGQLSNMLKPGYDHTTSPGYEFRRSEGLRGIEGSAASRGQLMSGGTLKDVMRYADGFASSDFNDQFNRVASVAAGGQQVNTTLGQLGANAATNAGNATMQGANARASGYMGVANNWINGINNVSNRLSSLPGMFGGGF